MVTTGEDERGVSCLQTVHHQQDPLLPPLLPVSRVSPATGERRVLSSLPFDRCLKQSQKNRGKKERNPASFSEPIIETAGGGAAEGRGHVSPQLWVRLLAFVSLLASLMMPKLVSSSSKLSHQESPRFLLLLLPATQRQTHGHGRRVAVGFASRDDHKWTQRQIDEGKRRDKKKRRRSGWGRRRKRRGNERAHMSSPRRKDVQGNASQ